MHKMTFFPLGNADCMMLSLNSGQRNMLFDFADFGVADNDQDKRVNLGKALKQIQNDAGFNEYDVVAITHLDSDHYSGFSEYFWLECYQKYQDDLRTRITELWVPAAIITEEGVTGEARVIRDEARHRLLAGEGIRVFSQPDKLNSFLESKGIDPEDRSHLISSAGEIVPGYTKENDGVEFFIHSPFSWRMNNDDNDENRNSDSLAFQACFSVDGIETRMLLFADVTCEILNEIVKTTIYYSRDEYLMWDIYKAPHHCSYKALTIETGQEDFAPSEEVSWLLETKRNDRCIIVSSSRTIEDRSDNLPPHTMAAEYYDSIAQASTGHFIVTMSHPTDESPKPLILRIDGSKVTVEKNAEWGIGAILSSPSPKVGEDDV